MFETGRATRRHLGWPLSARHRTGLLHPSRPCPAEGPSAECFDGSLPRHPPEGGPGACPSVLPLSPDQIALAALLPDVMWKHPTTTTGGTGRGELAADATSRANRKHLTSRRETLCRGTLKRSFPGPTSHAGTEDFQTCWPRRAVQTLEGTGIQRVQRKTRDPRLRTASNTRTRRLKVVPNRPLRRPKGTHPRQLPGFHTPWAIGS